MARPTTGVIVMAAFEPDPELFRRQLVSLAAQTVQDFECIISPDSDPAPLARVLADTLPDDDRFRILETGGERLGFYLNFERALKAVAPDAPWVALADQDDWWYPEKLEKMIPLLDEYGMVSGQARLVQYPSGTELGTTHREDASLPQLMLSNQFTGSLSIFRGDLLRLALPFPRLTTRAAAHDHWLAVCAAATTGTRVTSEIVQDYVQHSANVFGDPTAMAPSRSLVSSWKNARRMSRNAEGGDGLGAIVRTTYNVYVGWRELLTTALQERLGAAGALQTVSPTFGPDRRLRNLLPVLREGVRTGYVPRGFAVQYLASWWCGFIIPRSRRRPS